MDLIPLVDLLRDKKGHYKEAHLILFEKCNLSCSFCHQDHGSIVGMDGAAMFQKARTLLEVTSPDTPIVVNITGGELFMDEVPDEFFTYYEVVGEMVLKHFKDVKLVFGTNLIFNQAARVMTLLERLRPLGRVHLATSYDPAGRFSPQQQKLFMTNLMAFKDVIETVNVVITKQNIQAFLDGRENPAFAWMCETFDVYFDHYIPSQMYEYIQPDEELISKLYIHLNKRYPNSYPIKDWKANAVNETTCRSTKIINKDGVVSTCWSEAGKDAILDEREGLIAKDNAEVAFVEHYGCFSCEFYQRCGLRCFLHDKVLENTSKDCLIKAMFKVILA